MKTVQELLSDRGVLDGETDKLGQVAGAVTVRTFIEIFDENVEWDNRAIANVLYSLTDIQVRDYAMGLVNEVRQQMQCLHSSMLNQTTH